MFYSTKENLLFTGHNHKISAYFVLSSTNPEKETVLIIFYQTKPIEANHAAKFVLLFYQT